MWIKALIVSSAIVLSTGAARTEAVQIGQVPALASAATMIALEKGYFKQYGIDVEVKNLDSSIDALALVAQNRLQVVEGGISAAYFNALAKSFPITIAADRVSSPLRHELIVRADLKDQIKDVAQLKGRPLASNSRGSVTNYEIGKIMQKAGLTLHDADLKFIPFPQIAVAFANKAIDAAFLIQPFASQVVERGLGFVFADPDNFITPSPLTIAVNFINTDWAAKNDALVKNYFLAYMRAVRDYCQAYHEGPNRAEVIDIVQRTGIERRREMIDKYPWPARSAEGRINIDSMLDIQAFYVKEGLSMQQFPAERLVTTKYIDYANEKLGPFVVENMDSKLAGCR